MAQYAFIHSRTQKTGHANSEIKGNKVLVREIIQLKHGTEITVLTKQN